MAAVKEDVAAENKDSHRYVNFDREGMFHVGVQ